MLSWHPCAPGQGLNPSPLRGGHTGASLGMWLPGTGGNVPPGRTVTARCAEHHEGWAATLGGPLWTLEVTCPHVAVLL